ncbi:MAG: thioredoxin family protein [Firmicutes bacterium]|nr:thioredoxin family protein [Bacillota bacterium]
MRKLVVVSAVWCPSCLVMSKDLKKIKEEITDIEIEKLDYDFDLEVEKYNVGTKLPVLILEEDGVEINRIVGEKNYNEIVEFIGGK